MLILGGVGYGRERILAPRRLFSNEEKGTDVGTHVWHWVKSWKTKLQVLGLRTNVV